MKYLYLKVQLFYIITSNWTTLAFPAASLQALGEKSVSSHE